MILIFDRSCTLGVAQVRGGGEEISEFHRTASSQLLCFSTGRRPLSVPRSKQRTPRPSPGQRSPEPRSISVPGAMIAFVGAMRQSCFPPGKLVIATCGGVSDAIDTFPRCQLPHLANCRCARASLGLASRRRTGAARGGGRPAASSLATDPCKLSFLLYCRPANLLTYLTLRDSRRDFPPPCLGCFDTAWKRTVCACVCR